MGNDSGESPVRHKGPQVLCLGAKETGVTKTLKGFSVQSEELL